MKALSLSEAKVNLGRLVDEVERCDKEVVITRNGRPVAVLVSLDAYDRWKETPAIRVDRDLMREIRTGLAALKARKARLYTLDELVGQGTPAVPGNSTLRSRAPEERGIRSPLHF